MNGDSFASQPRFTPRLYSGDDNKAFYFSIWRKQILLTLFRFAIQFEKWIRVAIVTQVMTKRVLFFHMAKANLIDAFSMC